MNGYFWAIVRLREGNFQLLLACEHNFFWNQQKLFYGVLNIHRKVLIGNELLRFNQFESRRSFWDRKTPVRNNLALCTLPSIHIESPRCYFDGRKGKTFSFWKMECCSGLERFSQRWFVIFTPFLLHSRIAECNKDGQIERFSIQSKGSNFKIVGSVY